MIRWKDPQDTTRWAMKQSRTTGKPYFTRKYTPEELHAQKLKLAFQKAEYIGKQLLRRLNATLDNKGTTKMVYEALQTAGNRISRDAVVLFRSNFDKSGVGTKTPEKLYKHTHRLRDAVSKVRAHISTLGKQGLRIVFQMPPDVPNYQNRYGERLARPFYTVAGALQYGAIIQPDLGGFTYEDLPTGEIRVAKNKLKPMGSRMKATFKRVVLGGKSISKREFGWLTRSKIGVPDINKVRAFGKRSLEVRTSRGRSVIIIKPFRFFGLTATQKKFLMTRFLEIFNDTMEVSLGANTRD